MRIGKKVIDHIEKCYAVAEFIYKEQQYLLCSAEGKGPCRMYTPDGAIKETLWDGPGGVMTLLQLPDPPVPVLLATQCFFSPDDAKNGKIVYYYPREGQWYCETLCEMPFIHRFGVIGNRNEKYLIAATLKSDCSYNGDWSSPGKIWTAKLPENIFQYNKNHPLKFSPLISGLYKNHGFSINEEGETSYAVIGTDNGVYSIFSPIQRGGEWEYKKILEEPAGDILLRDFDNDGEKELLIISPFHGQKIKIYKRNSRGRFESVYQRDKDLPFAHAIWGGKIGEKEYAFLGGRDGNKELIAIFYDHEKGVYEEKLIDKEAGAANCMLFYVKGEAKLLAANRESDEVAIYDLSEKFK